jgi:metallo-beta-lactamase family protein
MEITFLGAVQTVTGSKYLLSFNHKKILVDCGLFQGLKELRLRNWRALPVDARAISRVILTHAHIDHSGYLPLLNKQGFEGDILCTHGTHDLCSVLLPDAGYLQEEEARYANKYGYSKHHPAQPLYTMNDALLVLKKFSPHPFHQPIALDQNTTLEFLHAGHIIGASVVRITHEGKTLVFSGDLGRPQDEVMRAPECVTEADALVIESTYGNRIHPGAHPLLELAEVINRAVNRGGSIIVPSFAVGRAQALLYFIYELKQRGEIPDLPVYLDSPMAESATDIFMKYPNEHRLSPEAVRAMCREVRYVRTPEESKQIDTMKTPIIVISASGMVTGGRVLHHIKHFAPNAKNTILFSGYQAEGTRGARMLGGEKQVKMLGEMVPIRAEVAVLENLSAHADANETIQWLKQFKRAPRQVFITHGEPASAATLKTRIESELGWHCAVPTYGQHERLF